MNPDLEARALAWSKKLPHYALQFEKERRLSPEIAEAFAEEGFFRMLVPKVYGGLECHPLTMVEVIKQIAIGDGAAGWNVMIGATTGLLAASLPEPAAMDIYGSNPNVLTVGVTAPFGRAEVTTGGGFTVSGRWPFGSGCQNAQWICGGCFLFQGETQLTDEQNQPRIRLMLFRSDQIEIEETWDVLGLCGTGSHHFSVHKAFVPDDYMATLGGHPRIHEPLYQFPLLGLLALGVASVALGIGYRALDEFIQLAGAKQPVGSTRNLAERTLAQAAVSQSKAELGSAEAWMKEVIASAWEFAMQGEGFETSLKADLRLAAANATHRAAAATSRLYEAAGGSSVYASSPLQKCFRDVHVTTQHIMVAKPIYEVVGRVQLGLPPKSML